MEVHINNIDNDLYITFESAMNVLDEIQRLRKEKKYDLCFINHLKKDIERLQKTIDKAREYIKETKDLSVDSFYKFNELCEADDLLNILNGDEE